MSFSIVRVALVTGCVVACRAGSPNNAGTGPEATCNMLFPMGIGHGLNMSVLVPSVVFHIRSAYTFKDSNLGSPHSGHSGASCSSNGMTAATASF